MDFKNILKGLIAAALAVFIGSNTTSGIYYENIGTLTVATILLGIFNIFLKPLLMLFSLPFIVLTFGLGIWIINALLFLLVASIVNGFYVESFVSALWGAFLLSVINLIATISLGGSKDRKFTVKFNRSVCFNNTNARSDGDRVSRQPKDAIKEDDVIDI